MKAKHAQSVTNKIHCKVCHTNAVGVTGHVGKRHKACPRPASNPKRRVGLWLSGHYEITPTAVGRRCDCNN